MVHSFFQTGVLSRQLNHTFIILIPKVDNPMMIGQYRPISLCNVAHKIISKLLTSRLKHVMLKMISEPQAAFVPARLIHENSIIAQELLHSMKVKRDRKGLASIKLDMEKAYHRLEWKFLLHTLKCFGFANHRFHSLYSLMTARMDSLLPSEA